MAHAIVDCQGQVCEFLKVSFLVNKESKATSAALAFRVITRA